MTTTEPRLEGKICLITGASSGIGNETALGLARLGAHVVMVARDRERGAAAQAAVRAATGNAAVDLLTADLLSQADIRRLAATVLANYDRLDVLVNNAGAYFTTQRETADGVERTLAVNYLAPFLLTHLLLDRLKASAPARIVNVSSGAHPSGVPRMNDLQGRRRYGGFRAYAQSKYLLVLWTYALARRLRGTGVTANCLHPGFVATNIGRRDVPQILAFLIGLAFARGISAAEGAQTSIYLASSPDVTGVSGKYFDKCRPVPSAPGTYDVALQERLWALTFPLVGLPAAP